MRRPPEARSATRSFVELVALALVAAVVGRAWLVQNFIVPTSSMAGTLRGMHRQVTCADCGHRFACGTDLRPIQTRARCPSCGFAENALADLPDLSGDRILVHKTAFAARQPHRWEAVVFRSPEEPDKICVKRAVGLPGETIQIIDGDVHVDGRIARKPLEQQRPLWIPVHAVEARSAERAPRWQSDASETAWHRDGAVFRYRRAGDADTGIEPRDAPIDWLVYHHRVRTPAGALEQPIVDDLSYNQNLFRRQEHFRPVRDLVLQCRLQSTGSGHVALLATDGRDEFELRIAPSSGQVELFHDGEPVAKATVPAARLTRPTDFEWSLVDRQVVVALDGQAVLPAYPFSAAARPLRPTSRPFACGAAGVDVEVSQLTVLRDVYYTEVFGPGPAWGVDAPYRLEGDEFFMLGDNSVISDDSRVWSHGPGVPTNLLVGKPLCVHFPSRWWDNHRQRFQVPDLARMHYIR